MNRKSVWGALALLVLLTGCATSRSVVSIPAGEIKPAQVANGKTVYFASLTDARVFEAKPKEPNIPSLDPSESQSAEIQARAIARKRNGYGKALGDILLPADETAPALVRKSLEKAFVEQGYTVITDPTQVKPDTFVVDVAVTKMWAWMNPGFMALTLSAEVATDLKIKQAEQARSESLAVKESAQFQTGMESNWVEVVQKALAAFTEQAKQKLAQ
ncbi:hypothetical protein [Chitiniphilus eburneus]|uniref:Flagellar biosynthesis protein n=2 Tax=Chitiniphilus eburneus TaxID=2571148 RepID=A0A4V5MRT6_9NEIS|nr:hypothetical protein [Chitiniphilus eburneus]TJZ77588.1 hypothetical protein FAZ21_04495 [Chitiniphilus eburneus]